tara:strand:+ start:962 stop:1639 length:678 start_codon:yes stop_codon:yes gene_type:complete
LPSYSNQSSSRTETLLLVFILIIYFFIFFPLIQVFLKDKPALYNNWNLIYFFTTLSILIITGRTNISKIGLAKTKFNNISLGLAFGILPIICVVILDVLIIKLGLSEKDLFAGAELRETINPSKITLLLQGVLKPVITMIFITGYTLNILLKKNEFAILGNGILYSSINFNFGVGYIIFGMIAAGLTRFTNSLYPAILFSVGCALAKFLILTNYPRITTMLVFLM